MNFFHYILQMQHVGMDLRAMMAFCKSWIGGGTPYIEVWVNNPYPPLTTVLYSPLTLLPIKKAYFLVTVITFLSYVLSCTVLTEKILGRIKDKSLIYLFLAAGLFSYGFHFEIERGQFNLIAITATLSAIVLWNKDGPAYKRILAYILISFGIQLKVYPALFALCLTDNLKDWKGNAIRIGTLGLCNFLALFVLGFDRFKEFMHYLIDGARNADKFLWVGAHSIKSFSHVGNFRQEPFWAILLLCFIITLVIGYYKKWDGKNRFLILAISCVTMLAPSISHDYKLSAFHPIACILMVGLLNYYNPYRYLRVLEYLGLTLISVSYFLTTYSYQNKLVWRLGKNYYRNNMPLLLTVFVTATVLLIIRTYVQSRSQHREMSSGDTDSAGSDTQ